MTKQEYKHIRNLAWDLLINSGASELPINIIEIAKLYNVEHIINGVKPIWDNTVSISQSILSALGYKSNEEFSVHLSARILAPMIVLKELNIQSTEDISNLTGLPFRIASQRYARYKMLISRNKFETSILETKVLSQFKNWIELYKSSH